MDKIEKPVDVAVVGVGRMGRHHARTYHNMDIANLVAVVDQDEDRAETVADEYGCKAYTSVEELMANEPSLQGVSVAVPTIYHTEAAKPLLKAGIACLIEKPLAQSVAEARGLAEYAEGCGTVLQVGHTERFNPAVRTVSAMDLTPRYIEVDRVSPMTFRSLDVGVVMDMMIHDLDIILMFAKSPIRQVDATGVSVLGEQEDVCSARIVFESGCVANLTASRLALKTERKLRLFSEQGYVSLNYASRSGIAVRSSKANINVLAEVRDQLGAGKDLSDLDYTEMIDIEELDMDVLGGDEDPLTAQATAFLHAAVNKHTPAVTALDGYAAVDAAERVVQAIKEHKWVGRDSSIISNQDINTAMRNSDS
ncbi:Dehydrogenase [Poriferisphaera corsica]|uniref:Dehydrogenase n=1 Tax=Poriferisphaera corsica TaxID=2528020 RepID=A0A517YT38_9BACT|nr:Gfo/Idh/MocA family oxidoreductase [Poriferisphaera corsica]QDU33407.1 Dehydrogenase [Poriferisphaera corsica]